MFVVNVDYLVYVARKKHSHGEQSGWNDANDSQTNQ